MSAHGSVSHRRHTALKDIRTSRPGLCTLRCHRDAVIKYGGARRECKTAISNGGVTSHR